MEKLIELLNKYEIEKWNNSAHGQSEKATRRVWSTGTLGSVYGTLMGERESRLTIISREYGFIGWLVNNGNINRSEVEYWTYQYFNCEVLPQTKEFRIDILIMILSIQDNPIEFLIGLLK